VTDRDIAAIGLRLLKPYRIPEECPYLSEDQRELSELDLKGRSAWMAEWLLLAAQAPRTAKTAPSWESQAVVSDDP
jgi:hypothetical protein